MERGTRPGRRRAAGIADGPFEQACFHGQAQRAVDGDLLYMADTHNQKAKRIRLAERRVESWLGDGRPGDRDGAGSAARFYEPSGVSVADGRLYVADTHSHAIQVADLATGALTRLRVNV